MGLSNRSTSSFGGQAELTEREILSPYSIGSILYHKPYLHVNSHDGSWESGDTIYIHFGDWMESLAGDTDIKVQLVTELENYLKPVFRAIRLLMIKPMSYSFLMTILIAANIQRYIRV